MISSSKSSKFVLICCKLNYSGSLWLAGLKVVFMFILGTKEQAIV